MPDGRFGVFIAVLGNVHHRQTRNMVRRMKLNPLPNHGVSGFQTTGSVGDFQYQFHGTAKTDVKEKAASRYGLQSHGTSADVERGRRKFNPYYNNPKTNYTKPEPNPSFFVNEPTFEEEVEGSAEVASKELSRALQRTRKPVQGSYLKDRLYEGFGQNDPAIQRMIRDTGFNEDIATRYAPNPKKHQPIDIQPPIRANEQQQTGTKNPWYQQITLDFLTGNDLANMQQILTPETMNNGFTSTGAHPIHAEALGPAETYIEGYQPVSAYAQVEGYQIPQRQAVGAIAPERQAVGTITPRQRYPYSLSDPLFPDATLGNTPMPDIHPVNQPGTLRNVVPQASFVAKGHRRIQRQL